MNEMDKPFFEWFAQYARKTWREYLLIAMLGGIYWWTSTNYLRIFSHGAGFLGMLVTAAFWFGWQYGVGKWENAFRLIYKDATKDVKTDGNKT